MNTIGMMKQIKDSSFRVPEGLDPCTFAGEILPFLGEKDGKIRDDLTYAILSHWMIENVLSDDCAAGLCGVVAGEEYVLCNIDGGDEVSVFKRSFSLLFLAAAVYRNRQKPFLSPGMLEKVHSAVRDYSARERNLTGYHPEYGWAHGAAHFGDVADELFQCGEFHHDRHRELLEGVSRLLLRNSRVYAHGEEDRLAFSVSSLAASGNLDLEEILSWISRLKEAHRRDPSDISALYRCINIRNFLKSLYFYSLSGTLPRLPEYLREAVEELMHIGETA